MRESTIQYVMREISPCDGCGHFERCGAELMACRAFAFYVRTGRYTEGTPRDPSYNTYKRVFSGDDEELNELIRQLNKEARGNE